MAKRQISYNQFQQSNNSVLSENSAVVRDNQIFQPNTYEQAFQLSSNQEQIIYDQKGLDYVSNLPFVNKRDAAGNLIINGNVQAVTDEEAAQYNETVIIEANDRLYTNSSVTRAIDTQFKYFKFPPNIITRQTDIEDINVEIPDNNLDIFSARYIPDPSNYYYFAPDEGSWPGTGPYGLNNLNFNTVIRGPQQTPPGTYTITPELIESGKNLRMRYAVRVYNSRSNRSLGFITTLQRISADYRPKPTDIDELYELVPARGQYIFKYEYVVENSTMRAWDKWSIQGLAGQYDRGIYMSDYSYWEIEAVDP